MSRYIAKYMNLKKLKRPTFWNGGSICHAPATALIGLSMFALVPKVLGKR